jgi:hypothetical protein
VSSTSTNKQPLLIDRPLHEFVSLGPTPGLIDPLNFASVLSGGCVPLVDCISENTDGAMVDSLSVVANQANTTQAWVVFFLSRSPSSLGVNGLNTAQVASARIASIAAGERVNVPLPALSVPVPSLGGEASPTEESKKNTGLFVPGGRILYVGLSEPLLLPTPATTINVFAQGGYY